MGEIQIKIDRQTCMGSGNCQFWAPSVFDLDDDGVAVVVEVEGDPEEKVVLAARGCPTQSITVFRDGEQIGP
ncbi:MAG: ferredoxin [Actinobacteria bacterium]|nr:ferredoxin [Actinomycetota bacterium]